MYGIGATDPKGSKEGEYSSKAPRLRPRGRKGMTARVNGVLLTWVEENAIHMMLYENKPALSVDENNQYCSVVSDDIIIWLDASAGDSFQRVGRTKYSYNVVAEIPSRFAYSPHNESVLLGARSGLLTFERRRHSLGILSSCPTRIRLGSEI